MFFLLHAANPPKAPRYLHRPHDGSCRSREGGGFFASIKTDDCGVVDYDLIKESSIVELMPIRTGYYSTLDDKFVRSCIKRKEERLLQYKAMPENREISEYWLFIRVATNSFSDLEDFQVGKYSSCYGRIYITDGGRVLQLK